MHPQQQFRIPFTPKDIPGLISFWNFNTSGKEFIAQQGNPYCLRSQSGIVHTMHDPAASFGATALVLEEGQWLSIPRHECPALDIHGKEGHLTLVAWIKRARTKHPHCEFIAGQWNESNNGRQYGLFLNINVWGVNDRIFGHLSHTGGPTAGYRYCMDGCMSATAVPYDTWVTVAMSYDGQAGYAWFNGLLDVCPQVNPYPLSGGLHNGGPTGSDFTLGAVNRSGEIGNFFSGCIAALAVYRRALTPAEMFALCSL